MSGLRSGHHAAEALQEAGAFGRCQTRGGEDKRAEGTAVNIDDPLCVLSLLHLLMVDKERLDVPLDVRSGLRVEHAHIEKRILGPGPKPSRSDVRAGVWCNKHLSGKRRQLGLDCNR